MAKDRFEECVEFVLVHETEYDRNGKVKVERDPADPGGTTKYGIDQRSHPHIDVATLSREEARVIYRAEKWDKFHCGEMKPPWDLVVFDSAVNPGEGWMPKALQKAVGAKVDGIIGPKTIKAVNEASVNELENFLRAREAYYRARPAKLKGKPFRERYLEGWLNRTADLKATALTTPDSVAVA